MSATTRRTPVEMAYCALHLLEDIDEAVNGWRGDDDAYAERLVAALTRLKTHASTSRTFVEARSERLRDQAIKRQQRAEAA